jgi:hypothetical protein
MAIAALTPESVPLLISESIALTRAIVNGADRPVRAGLRDELKTKTAAIIAAMTHVISALAAKTGLRKDRPDEAWRAVRSAPDPCPVPSLTANDPPQVSQNLPPSTQTPQWGQ